MPFLFGQVNDSTSKDKSLKLKEEITPIEKVNTGIPKIQFKHYTHNFGHIAQGIPVSFEFEFFNKGYFLISLIFSQLHTATNNRFN